MRFSGAPTGTEVGPSVSTVFWDLQNRGRATTPGQGRDRGSGPLEADRVDSRSVGSVLTERREISLLLRPPRTRSRTHHLYWSPTGPRSTSPLPDDGVGGVPVTIWSSGRLRSGWTGRDQGRTRIETSCADRLTS